MLVHSPHPKPKSQQSWVDWLVQCLGIGLELDWLVVEWATRLVQTWLEKLASWCNLVLVLATRLVPTLVWLETWLGIARAILWAIWLALMLVTRLAIGLDLQLVWLEIQWVKSMARLVFQWWATWLAMLWATMRLARWVAWLVR